MSGIICVILLINTINYSIAAGPGSGTYIRIARALKEIWDNDDVKFNIVNTNGSLENLKLLEKKEVQFAIIQNDVLDSIVNYNPEFMKNYSSVVPLYEEVLQVIAKKDAKISDLSQLNYRKIILGYTNSGTSFTARYLLNFLFNKGYPENAKEIYGITVNSLSEFIDSLSSPMISAAFFVSKVPDPLVAYFMTQGKYKLIPFSSSQLKRLKKLKKVYLPYTIGRKTYVNQIKSVTSIAVPAILVVDNSLDSSFIYLLVDKFLNSIKNPNNDIYYILKKSGIKEIKKLRNELVLPLHKGARARLDEINRFSSPSIWTIIFFFVFSLSILLFLSPSVPKLEEIVISFIHGVANIAENLKINLSNRFSIKLRRSIYSRNTWRFIRVISLFLISWMGGAILLFYLENDVNSAFSTILNSFISVMVYFLSGFEDRMPVTLYGWIISTFILIIGILTVAFITGQLASYFLSEKLEVKEMDKMSKNFIVIIGWSSRASKIVDEIISAPMDKLRKYAVKVITDKPVEDEQKKKFSDKGVFFIVTDTFDKESLKEVYLHKAKSVIIVADDNYEDPDAKTVMSIVAVKKVFDEMLNENNQRPSIIVEMKNHRKMELAKDAGANVVICHEDYGLGVIAQSAFAEKSAIVYHNLLHYSKDSNEIYLIKHDEIPHELKREFSGKEFSLISELFNENRKKFDNNPIILIGFFKNDSEVKLNPRDDVKYEDKDGLIFIAWEKPDMEKIKKILCNENRECQHRK